jgi:translation initiation factor IF-2
MLRYGLTSGANLSRRLALAPASSALIPRAGHAQIAFKSSKALEEEESPNSSGNSKNSGKQQESRKDLPSFLGTVGGPSSSNSFSGGGGTDALKAFFEKRRATLEKEKSQLQKSEKPQPTNRRQQPQSNAGRGQANRPARSNNTAGSACDFTALRNALSRKPQPKPQQQQQQQQQGSQQRQAQPQQQQQGSQQRQAQPQQQQGSQQRPQQSQINRNNNPNPQQQQQRSSRPLPNNTTTTINRGRQNQQSYERNNGGSENNRQEIPRLADLMKHLRPDVLSQQPREQNTNRRDSMQRQEQPQWRQRRQQQQQQQRPGQDSMEQRQFQQRPSFSQRGPRQPFQRQRNDDFLQGRITRADEDDAASTAATQAALKKQDETRTITLPLDDMTLTELSILYRVKVDDIKKKLKSMGERVNDEYMLDVDMAELLAMEYGFETVRSTPRTVMDAEQILLQRRAGAEEVEESPSSSFTTEVEKPSFDSLPPRPPVVCIMGHVDHGKTTLMDALRRRSLQQQGGGGKEKKQKGGATAARSKDVAGTEAGGITQIISAFQVALEGQDSAVTFLDTPGHAAFSAMRQSGSHAADVIVLVVAADDGVSEQTIEIINFYKSIVQGAGDSGISMIIALNKIDKPGLDVDQAKTRIENQLLEHGIITEGLNYSGSEYGLPVTVVPTSGLTGQGLDELMESLLLQSEIMDLRADDKARGEGIVMDARLEKGLGVVVDCIVRWGTIKKGDVVVSGTQLGKVRMLKDGE